MKKDQLIKARCTATEKKYLLELMHTSKYKSLSEALRAVINNHMINNPIEKRNGGKIEFKQA